MAKLRSNTVAPLSDQGRNRDTAYDAVRSRARAIGVGLWRELRRL